MPLQEEPGFPVLFLGNLHVHGGEEEEEERITHS